MITANALDLSQATEQDVFDIIAFLLIQQGRPSYSTDLHACVYRDTKAPTPGEAPSLLRCGIGHIIPDAEFSSLFEGKSVCTLLNGELVEIPNALPSLTRWTAAGNDPWFRRDLLSSIQRAHDEATRTDDGDACATPAAWLQAFRVNARAVARDYRLNADIVSYREPAAPASRPPYSIIGADDEVFVSV
jgi:hypothetical protein